MNISFKSQDFINASKALLTVSLTLIAVYSFLPVTSLYFALYTAACCAFMQAGASKLDQLVSMILGGAAFIFFLALGLAIKDEAVFADGALILFAFAAFYLPNLGIKYKMPPVLGLIFYVSVINMNTTSCPYALSILGCTIGASIAIVVYFLFWPYQVTHELTLIAQSVIRQYRILLERCMPRVRQAEEDEARINTLLSLYEQLNTAAHLKPEEADYFDKLYLTLYGLLQTNTMMIASLPALSAEKRALTQKLLRDLRAEARTIEYSFDQMLPHSFIARHVFSKSLRLGKALMLRPDTQRRPKGALSSFEFNALLEALLAPPEEPNIQQFAFGLLRLRELLKQLSLHQEGMHLNLKQGVFI